MAMTARDTIIVAVGICFIGVAAGMLYSTTQDIVPLTATLEEINYVQSVPVEKRVYTFVRRGDGSVVESRTDRLPEGLEVRSRFIYDLGRKVRISVNDLTGTTTTYPYRGDRFTEVYKAVKTGCTTALNPPSDTMLGFRIVKVGERQDNTHAEGVRISERWVAPELGCADMKRITRRVKPDGSAELLTVFQATAVKAGEPDPSWFTIPSHYVERKPSDAMRELRKIIPSAPWPSAESVDRLDEAYRQSHANIYKMQQK